MSWLVRSLTAPFQEQEHVNHDGVGAEENRSSNSNENERERIAGGVKEDLSELTNTLRRQLWGVAQFIAPPPAAKSDDPKSKSDESDDALDENRVGIRTGDLPGRVKAGFSRIMQSLALDEDDFGGSAKPPNFSASLTEISRFASSFLPSNMGKLSEEEEGRVVGLTEDVVSFAVQISQHPGTWLDFPLDREDGQDFDMSDVQQEHALAVESYVPSLSALRIDLCPGYMSENRFWMIYFVLIHPRLSKEDALLLSTPQVLEARALLSQELQRRNMAESGKDVRGLDLTEGTSPSIPQEQKDEHALQTIKNHEKVDISDSISLPTTTLVTGNDVEGDHKLSSVSEISSQTNSNKEPPLQNDDMVMGTSNDLDLKYDDEDIEGENWWQDESAGNEEAESSAAQLGNEEDVSFSDLEDDDT
uniref:BSD domain-containing protein n=1 Tax=Araucaria cunninghamii TaxID=56994 RepID=A0A0D6QRV7_ARACU